MSRTYKQNAKYQPPDGKGSLQQRRRAAAGTRRREELDVRRIGRLAVDSAFEVLPDASGDTASRKQGRNIRIKRDGTRR